MVITWKALQEDFRMHIHTHTPHITHTPEEVIDGLKRHVGFCQVPPLPVEDAATD